LVSLKEMKDREYVPHTAFIQLMVRGVTSVLKVSAFHLPEVMRMRVIHEDQERFVRPTRMYQVPKYVEGMKSVRSEDKYLRPTLLCDPNDPRIVAMAHELGAFQVSDRVFAERAHHLAKELMRVEYVPLCGVGDTLERGTGTCFHLAGVMVALCRCAGIKARYKIFAMSMIASWYHRMLGADSFMQRWYDSLGYFLLEAEVEVMLDGEWETAVVGPDAGWQASVGTQVSKLGETSLGDWFEAVPGTVMITESLPYGLATMGQLMITLAPGSVERVNLNVVKLSTEGDKIIADAGGIEAYNAMVRAKTVKMPKMEMENIGQITFD
jgi:hypothetical protein